MFYYFHHSVHRAAREGDAEWSKAAGTRDRRGRPSHPRAQKPCRQVSWAAIAETITALSPFALTVNRMVHAALFLL